MKALVPPPPQRILPAVEQEILRLTRENFGGCKLIAGRVGVSHMTVIRVWSRNNIDRAQLAARNAIVEAHQDLAARIAKSVASELPVHMRSDLSGVALVALTQVAAEYDPARGVPFGAFAQQRIRGACLDSIRRRHYVNATAVEYTSEQSESRSDSTASVEVSAIESESRRARRAKAVEIIQKLPGRLAVLLWLHYIEEQTLEAIAPKLGVVASRLSQLHWEGISILKAQMGEKS